MKYSFKKILIIEEFISGSLHDVNGIISKRNFFKMGITDKLVGQEPYFIVKRADSPSKLSRKMQLKLYKFFYLSCKTLGLGPGPVKGDFILDKKGKFYLMEIGARFHGPLGIIHLIPNSMNISPFIELINFIENKKIRQHEINSNNYSRSTVYALPKKIFIKKRKNENILFLKKKGKKNEVKWKSNLDVPYYVVRSKIKDEIN